MANGHHNENHFLTITQQPTADSQLSVNVCTVKHNVWQT